MGNGMNKVSKGDFLNSFDYAELAFILFLILLKHTP